MRDGGILYNIALCHAELAGIAAKPGSGMTPADGQAEADRAMEWFKRAIAVGYRNRALVWTDTALDLLRSRPEFQLLMMDLAFPNDAFAHGD